MISSFLQDIKMLYFEGIRTLRDLQIIEGFFVLPTYNYSQQDSYYVCYYSTVSKGEFDMHQKTPYNNMSPDTQNMGHGRHEFYDLHFGLHRSRVERGDISDYVIEDGGVDYD